MALSIHIDGGARGNPGPAGAGVVIRRDGRALLEAGFFLGRQTNNAAEYGALILALKHAARLGGRALTIHSDSELLVKQMTGEYRVKNAALGELAEQAQMLLLRFDSWTIRHVRREQNRRADELVNLAIDRSADAIVTDANAKAAGPAPAGVPTSGDAAVASDDATGAQTGQADARSQPQPHSPPQRLPAGAARAIRVHMVEPPAADGCPAGPQVATDCTLEATLPAGICLHAAHALVPTALAMNNTDVKEFAALPTITVRCMQPGCGASFQLSPVKPGNGAARPAGPD